MITEDLNANFAIPGILSFDDHNGLTRANVTTLAASATIYLQGAHLTHWQPAGQNPVLFTSEHSDFAPGKPIRGGVPVLFPWFGPDTLNRASGQPAPSHGFARILPWDLAFAALAGDDLHLTFTLAPDETTRSFGYDQFRLAYQLTIGPTLTMQLTIANDTPQPLRFEEGLHTYFAVSDVRQVTVSGLEPTSYLDKMDGMNLHPAAHQPLTFASATDRVYLDTTAACILHDPAGSRQITISKSGSDATVVWNPWSEIASRLPDLGNDEWPHMLCIETVNAATNAVTLSPGQTHSMQCSISVDPTSSPS